MQKLLRAALELTERQLGYLYGSAEPDRGGMELLGNDLHYLLQADGVADVPRSASEQYVWTRKANTFIRSSATKLDSFEFGALRPGDLLFWTGTYSVNVDPPVSHTMIYLGKARSDGRPLMVGASDGRTYRGEKNSGSASSTLPCRSRTPRTLAADLSATQKFRDRRVLRRLSTFSQARIRGFRGLDMRLVPVNPPGCCACTGEQIRTLP